MNTIVLFEDSAAPVEVVKSGKQIVIFYRAEETRIYFEINEIDELCATLQEVKRQIESETE